MNKAPSPEQIRQRIDRILWRVQYHDWPPPPKPQAPTDPLRGNEVGGRT
ncbi:hypothetical protein [Thiohalocapsa marina]